jgi:hypothetical protein
MGLWINPHSWLWLSPFYFWDWWSLPLLPKKNKLLVMLPRAVLHVCKYTYSTIQSKHTKRSTCLGLKMQTDHVPITWLRPKAGWSLHSVATWCSSHIPPRWRISNFSVDDFGWIPPSPMSCNFNT